MRRKSFLIAAVLAAAIAAPAERATANDAFIGGLIGGAIGSAISNDIQRKNQQKRSTKRYVSRPSVSSAQREENRSVQRALNYFGFNAGGADGQLGPRSRAAMSAYQAHLGYPITGNLTPYEKQFLLTSHSRALAGGPATSTAIARAGGITSGLLTAWRDEAQGGGSFRTTSSYGGLPPIVAQSVDEIANSSDPTGDQLIQRAGFIQLADMNGDGQTDYLIDTSVTGSAFWCNAQACAVRVFVSTPAGYERNDFQAFNVTPAMFSCQRGLCQMANTGTVMAAAPQSPAPQGFAPAPAPVQAGQVQGQFAAQIPGQATLPVAAAVPSVGAPTTGAASAASFAAVPTPTPAPVPAPVQGGVVAASGAGAGAAPSGGLGLPTFFAKPATEASLASHCNTVSLVTTTNGGFTTLNTLSDPSAALAEQFCLARTYAIANGEQLLAKVTGVDASEIDAQCTGLAQTLSGATAALSLRGVAPVRQEVAELVLASGMSPAALADSARICLGVGYRTDDMDVALASALLLVVVGYEPYAELLGHHIGQGFGASKRQDLALAWYAVSNGAIERGATPAFAPGQPERAALIQAATTRLATGQTGRPVVPAATQAAPEDPPFSGLRVIGIQNPPQ